MQTLISFHRQLDEAIYARQERKFRMFSLLTRVEATSLWSATRHHEELALCEVKPQRPGPRNRGSFLTFASSPFRMIEVVIARRLRLRAQWNLSSKMASPLLRRSNVADFRESLTHRGMPHVDDSNTPVLDIYHPSRYPSTFHTLDARVVYTSI